MQHTRSVGSCPQPARAVAERAVRPTIGYALSQRNNHAISELAFLLASQERPERRLCRRLAETLDDQFFDDGSYLQQSFVYQRLAVHTLLWLLEVQPCLPIALEAKARRAVARSVAFWERTTDPVSGLLPNYGSNDGSVLLALGTWDPLDSRGTIAMAADSPCAARWGEGRCWIRSRVATDNREPALAESTYRTMRGRRSLLLTRVGLPRGCRPADDDQQAVELFIDGRRIVLDPGTYRYSGSPPWRNPFVGTALHCNLMATDAVAARPQIGRFLRAPMPEAHLIVHENCGDDGEILVTMRTEAGTRLTRSIVRIGDSYAIVDEAECGQARVRWNLADDMTGIVFDAKRVAANDAGPASVEMIERSPDRPESGWWAPTYAQLEPCSVRVVALSSGEAAMTRFAPADQQLLDPGWVTGTLRTARRSLTR